MFYDYLFYDLFYDYLLYIILVLIVVITTILLYIKWKFRFWAMQPVFHVYDLHYYLFPCGVIETTLPEKNRYCNFQNIQVIKTDQLEDHNWIQFMHFIQKYYLQNNDNIFMPKMENIRPYFIGHNTFSLMSMYTKEESVVDTVSQNIMTIPKIISVMTTRPLHCCIYNHNKYSKNAPLLFDIYYVDYLCVSRNQRKGGIAQQTIQTHDYIQRHMNKSIPVSLFKREGELTGIVPLCVYNSYGYEMDKWPVAFMLPQPLNIIEIGKTNLQHYVDFFAVNNKRFDITIYPEISNIAELIKTDNMYIFLMVQNTEVLAAYIFKRTCTTIRKNVEILSCSSSINCCKNEDIYINGFKIAVDMIRKKQPQYGYCIIENIADNDVIIKNISTHFEPDMTSPTAYFFYNYAYSTFDANKVLIIE